MRKGKFITFEGCEGVGKSTQVNMLKDYLKKTGQNAMFLREPGGNILSEKIRKIILDPENSQMTSLCEAMLYSAARAQLMGQVIIPALDKGEFIICDRFIDSTMAYQGFARDLGVDIISCLNEMVCGDYMPDVTIFLDLPPDEAFKRKGGRDSNDRMELQSLDFHKKVYAGYKKAADMYPDRIILISPRGNKFETHTAIIRNLQARGIIN